MQLFSFKNRPARYSSAKDMEVGNGLPLIGL